MKTRVLVSLALFVGIGASLHAIIPGFFFGMKPDMMLLMMFLGILTFPEKKNVLLLGIATGIISALTTTFPGGQLPNIIDKIITSLVFFSIFLLFKKYITNAITAGIVTAIGTMISGTVFLTSALLIVGLPGGAAFLSLFLAVVLPATAINGVAMIIIYPIIQAILRRMNIAVHA